MTVADACYVRWLRHGRKVDADGRPVIPAALPPGGPPGGARGPAAGRVEDYAWLRREMRETRERAAERLGVTVRTAWRYEAQLRRQAS